MIEKTPNPDPDKSQSRELLSCISEFTVGSHTRAQQLCLLAAYSFSSEAPKSGLDSVRFLEKEGHYLTELAREALRVIFSIQNLEFSQEESLEAWNELQGLIENRYEQSGDARCIVWPQELFNFFGIQCKNFESLNAKYKVRPHDFASENSLFYNHPSQEVLSRLKLTSHKSGRVRLLDEFDTVGNLVLSAVGQGYDSDAADLFNKAMNAYRYGYDYKPLYDLALEAIDKFRQKISPTYNQEPLVTRVKTHILIYFQQLEEARELLEGHRISTEDDFQIYLKLASHFYQANDHGSAILLIDHAFSHSRHVASFPTLMGIREVLKGGDFELAEIILERYPVDTLERTLSHEALVEAYSRKAQLVLAMSLMDDILPSDVICSSLVSPTNQAKIYFDKAYAHLDEVLDARKPIPAIVLINALLSHQETKEQGEQLVSDILSRPSIDVYYLGRHCLMSDLRNTFIAIAERHPQEVRIADLHINSIENGMYDTNIFAGLATLQQVPRSDASDLLGAILFRLIKDRGDYKGKSNPLRISITFT